jgi:hypothetical protein
MTGMRGFFGEVTSKNHQSIVAAVWIGQAFFQQLSEQKYGVRSLFLLHNSVRILQVFTNKNPETFAPGSLPNFYF